MLRQITSRLTYANVMATIALLLALGGTSYAVAKLSGKNLKNHSVSGKKLKKNTLTGRQINESKLRSVPHADSADSAANADELDGKDSESFRLACPAGTTPLLGICFETTLRAAGTFSQAARACGEAQRRLPTFAELEGARQNGLATGSGGTDYELSGSIARDGADLVIAIDGSGNRFPGDYLTYSKPFRCVALPSNTG
jgi:hypothetical protein